MITSMGKYEKLAKNSLFVFIGNIGSRAIGFIMLPFYTSWLSVEQYGTVDLVTVYVSLLLPFISFSLSSAIFAIPVGHKKEEQGQYFTIGLVFVLASIVVSSLLIVGIGSLNIIEDEVFNKYTVYICIMLLTSFLQTYIQQFCMAIDKMFVFSCTGIVLAATTAIGGFILIPNQGIEGYLKAIIVANVITILFTAIIMKAYEYIILKSFNTTLLKEMLKYRIPMIPNKLLWWIIASFNRVTMNQYIGVYYLGLYAIASKLPSIISSMINPLSNSWKLSVVQEYKNEDFNKYYSNISQAIVMIVSLGVMILGILSELIIGIITDTEYHVSWIYSPILLLSVVFVTLDQMVAPIFMAYRKTKYFLYASLCGAIIGVILNFVLIPFIGIWGAVISMVGSHAILSLVQLKMSWRFEKNKSIWRIIFFIIITIICNSILSVYKNYIIAVIIFVFSIGLFFYYNWNQMNQLIALIQKKRKK